MGLDWFSVCLGVLIVLIFAAIFTLLRTMSSPYIKRFDLIVKGQLEEIDGTDESYRIKFALDGRPFEVLELKHQTREDFKKVYNSFVLMKARTNTTFTLRISDALTQVGVAGVLVDVLKEQFDSNDFKLDTKTLGEFFREFRVSTNDRARAEKFLSNPEVLSVLTSLRTQFSAYGYLMPFFVNQGTIILDYSLSERLLNELIFNPRNILEHARLLNILARHIEAAS